jgi:hypothetical protein
MPKYERLCDSMQASCMRTSCKYAFAPCCRCTSSICPPHCLSADIRAHNDRCGSAKQSQDVDEYVIACKRLAYVPLASTPSLPAAPAPLAHAPPPTHTHCLSADEWWKSICQKREDYVIACKRLACVPLVSMPLLPAALVPPAHGPHAAYPLTSSGSGSPACLNLTRQMRDTRTPPADLLAGYTQTQPERGVQQRHQRGWCQALGGSVQCYITALLPVSSYEFARCPGSGCAPIT